MFKPQNASSLWERLHGISRLRALALLPGHFRRDKKGATAVEFGLVLLPFTALLFVILETALVFWSTQVLETAVGNASRQIFTGQLATSFASVPPAMQRDKFKDLVCSNVPALFDCPNLVKVDAKSFSSFDTVSVPPIATAGVVNATGFGFNQGGPGDIVVVRAWMEYPTYVSLLGSSLANLQNGKRLIMASAAFRNEPYGN